MTREEALQLKVGDRVVGLVMRCGTVSRVLDRNDHIDFEVVVDDGVTETYSVRYDRVERSDF